VTQWRSILRVRDATRYFRSAQLTSLNVCFMGGMHEFRAGIAEATSEGEEYGNIKLNFGDPQNPQELRPNYLSKTQLASDIEVTGSLVVATNPEQSSFARPCEDEFNWPEARC
jgi:hypothetical protein